MVFRVGKIRTMLCEQFLGFVRFFRTRHQVRKCSEDQKKEEYYIIYDRVFIQKNIFARKHTLWKYNMNLAFEIILDLVNIEFIRRMFHRD